MLSFQSRFIAFTCAILLLSVVYMLLRRRRLDNFYSILWIIIAFVFMTISIFPNILNIISQLLGIDFVPLSILVLSIFALSSIVLHLSIIITKHNQKIREFEKKISYLVKTIKK
jgi:hypothetical protein